MSKRMASVVADSCINVWIVAGQFVGGNKPDKEVIITDYIDGKQPLRQLSEKYSLRMVWNRLNDMHHVISKHKDVVINMDAPYGQELWTDDHKRCIPQQDSIARFVRDERVANYLEGIEWLRSKGFKIYGIGMRGLFPALKSYRVQMCQYHNDSDCTQAPDPKARP